jgi:Leucine-rich repeat (LRR) protein
MVSWGNVDILLDSFVGLTSLTELDLGHEGGVRNGRVTLHRGTFHGLISLQKLSLRATWTTGLPVGVFEGLSSLKELNMWAFDPAAPLVPGVFQGLDSLETLDLSSYRSHEGYSTDWDMKFHTTHPDKAALVQNLFTGLHSLKKFDLSDCNLRSIQPGVFKGLDQLQVLDISGNYFESIPAGTFSDLPNLTDLSLNGDSPAAWLSYDENGILNMQMAVIQPGAFQGLIALKHLDLKLSVFSVFSKSAAGLRSNVNAECEHGPEWPNGLECVE